MNRLVGLTRLEKKNCHLSQVEIYEMPCFMGDIWAKVPPNYAMPSGIILFVKLFFDVRCNVLKKIKRQFYKGHGTNQSINNLNKKIKVFPINILTFSMLYFSKACVAQSTASCCISSDMSAFLITAFRSAILVKSSHNFCKE